MGFSFCCSRYGHGFIGPITFNVGRFLVGFLTLLPFFYFFEFKKIKKKKLIVKKFFYLILLGFILGCSRLQQISLIYTDVANTGVFTVMYVLIVPFISYFIFSKKIHWSVWPAVIFCVIGGLLLSELKNISLDMGIHLEFLSAFCWALHIIYISKTVKFFNFPITIAMSQCFVAFLFTIFQWLFMKILRSIIY